MRLPRTSLATAAILGSGAVGFTAVPAHAASAGTTLYVQNVTGCSNQTTDSSVAPFCSIQGALDAVQPGQTVQIASGVYNEADVVTARGTADAPITITAAPGATVAVEHVKTSTAPVVDFEDAAYVTLSGIELAGYGAELGLVNGSSHISFIGDRFNAANTTTGLVVTGSDATFAARDMFAAYNQHDGVLVNGASTGTVVTASWFPGFGGVRIDGAVDTAVTGITAEAICGAGIDVENGSTGTAIENDILGSRNFSTNSTCPASDAAGDLVVSADSVGGTHVDYNLLDSIASGNTVYRWGTQTFSQAAAFQTATGQGAHDIVGDPKLDGSGRPAAGSPAIDSADSGAIGEQTLDTDGYPRVVDPGVTQTGVGPRSYDDRGARETRDPFQVNGMEYAPVGSSFKTTITAFSNGWYPAASYTFDFGDGHPVTQASATIVHTFPAAGQVGAQIFPVTITASEADPNVTASRTYNVQLIYTQPNGSLTASTVKAADGKSYSLVADASGSTAGTEPIASYTFTVTKGGGTLWPFTTTVTQTSPVLTLPGLTEGDYSIGVTVTDTLGVTDERTIQESVPVRPVGAVTVHRIAGGDRYGTGVAVSQQMWAAAGGDSTGRRTAGAVVLATGEGFADAVAGVPLAAKVNGPLLLTDPDGLTPATAGEITRILPAHQGKTVYVLGGGGAISPAVDAQLKTLGYTVVRFGGSDRFATALEIAKQEFPDARTAYVATGEDYADALTAGPLAAAVGNAPIVLSDGPAIDDATETYLRTLSSVTTVGGLAAAALDTAGIHHANLSGATRYETAAAVAAAFPQKLEVTTVGIATGMNYADALTGGAMMAVLGQPLLLTAPSMLPQQEGVTLGYWLHLNSVSVFGGTGAVGADVFGAIVETVRGRVV